MKDLKNIHKNYIGIYPNVVTEDFCKKVLNKYNFNKKSFDLKSGKRSLVNRQETENVLKFEKEDQTLFLKSLDCYHRHQHLHTVIALWTVFDNQRIQ